MWDWITTNWPFIVSILGGSGIAALWIRRLRAIIKAIIVGVEAYGEEMASDGKEVKKSIKDAATAAGVEDSLKKIVDKETK